MTQWIAIKDQMPPQHQTLLFYCSNGDVYQGRPCYGLHAPWFCGHSKLNFGIVLADKGLTVTHWQPNLEPPNVSRCSWTYIEGVPAMTQLTTEQLDELERALNAWRLPSENRAPRKEFDQLVVRNIDALIAAARVGIAARGLAEAASKTCRWLEEADIPNGFFAGLEEALSAFRAATAAPAGGAVAERNKGDMSDRVMERANAALAAGHSLLDKDGWEDESGSRISTSHPFSAQAEIARLRADVAEMAVAFKYTLDVLVKGSEPPPILAWAKDTKDVLDAIADRLSRPPEPRPVAQEAGR